jgi:hypothetical protein
LIRDSGKTGDRNEIAAHTLVNGKGWSLSVKERCGKSIKVCSFVNGH